MRRLNHLTPRYIVDRTSVLLWQRRNRNAPWLTSVAVDLLAQWLVLGDTVFEWGSGQSTVWFAERVGRVISVEHDAVWFDKVAERLEANGTPRDGVERHLVEAVEAAVDGRKDEYVGVIDRIDDGSIDLVLVDGLHRDECADRAVQKVRPGGLLVLDNADWYFGTGSRTPGSRGAKHWTETWARFDKTISRWRRIITSNGVWDTAIWIKPPV